MNAVVSEILLFMPAISVIWLVAESSKLLNVGISEIVVRLAAVEICVISGVLVEAKEKVEPVLVFIIVLLWLLNEADWLVIVASVKVGVFVSWIVLDVIVEFSLDDVVEVELILITVSGLIFVEDVFPFIIISAK